MPLVTEIAPEKIRPDSNLFQSPFWACFKHNRGHHTQAFSIRHKQGEISMLVVYRPCAADGCYGFVPRGPDMQVPQDRQGPFLESLSESLRRHLPEECRFLRYDLPWASPFAPEDVGAGGWAGPPEPRIREIRMNFGTGKWQLRKAPTDMYPTNTVVLDLERTAAQIRTGMHQKTRYSIRKSFQAGVRVERLGAESLPIWHRMYVEMAVRKGLVAEKPGYFIDLFKAACHHAPELRLFIAFAGGRPLAGSIITFHRSTAYYLFSASSTAGRNRLASYAVLWEAILEARDRGCRRFDLFGIPPNDDPSHPMHGLFRFKTRFGGKIRHYRGCWDYLFEGVAPTKVQC